MTQAADSATAGRHCHSYDVESPKDGRDPYNESQRVALLKQEGDLVQVGEAVVELETEKVSYELESPIAGVLLKIVAGESAQVPVGGPLCHIGRPGDLVPAEKE